MAASSSSNSVTTSNSSAFSRKPLDFSADFPPRMALTADQVKYCTEALGFFKEKLQAPYKIAEEFAYLQENRLTPSEMKRRCTVALNGVNLNKNRYTDVLPFDKNRVVLESSTDYRPEAQGYINASFISTTSSGSVSQFIATQGPLPHTYEDFWEMVLQHHCPAVVMLTKLVDHYRMVKCGDYFQAEDGPREFGNISITSRWIKSTETSLVLRHLEVKHNEVAKELVKNGIREEHIGIITPYNSQANLIRHYAHITSVEIHTIDKYQGRDKDCILVSFVRSTESPSSCSSSLLGDWHRINVALTRAKRKLVMVGSRITLSRVSLLRLLIKKVEEQSGILSVSKKDLYQTGELKRCSQMR